MVYTYRRLGQFFHTLQIFFQLDVVGTRFIVFGKNVAMPVSIDLQHDKGGGIPEPFAQPVANIASQAKIDDGSQNQAGLKDDQHEGNAEVDPQAQ
jgi:hypothetical protein